jgi:hypothetical protein
MKRKNPPGKEFVITEEMMAKVPMPSAAEIVAARRRGEEADRVEPRVVSARFDARRNAIVMELRRGATVSIPVALVKELKGASRRQLAEVRAMRFGNAIEFEDLDMHISVKGLMRELVGLTGAAALLGSEGGKSRSAAKSSAARTNGKRGGRPRKQSAA